MAVVDELVVKLGLDPKQFNDGQKKALDQFKNTVDEFKKQGQQAEDQSKSLTDFLSNARSGALKLFAVFAGAKGLTEFTEQTVRSTAATGRLAHGVSLSVVEISKLQGLARVFGGDAGTMAAGIVSISDALADLKMGHITPLIGTLRQLSSAGGVTVDPNAGPLGVLSGIADNLKNIRERFGNDVAGDFGRRLGLDPALFEALIQGSAKFNENLGKIKGSTEADAKAALELQQRWDGFLVAAENGSKRAFFGFADLLKKLYVTPGIEKPSNSWEGPTEAASGGASAPANGTGNPAYREAIASIESKGSGGYAAVGPVTASGDHAYGRYQIMGNNIGPWSEAALGKRMSIQEFMASQSAQDAIFDHKFGSYVKQFGNPQDAASAWLTGRPLSTGGGARDLYGTSGASYAQRFTDNLRGIDRGNSGGNSTSHTVNVNGPINISVPSGQDPQAFASAFKSALKRQASAAQANGGQN